ncbi:MAG: P-loop NTPase fold protein [Gammaproteobacteria bacterium]
MNFESPIESGDPRWQDLGVARGDDATLRLRRLFDRKPPGQPLHAVFSSHRGAGKTTELKRFAHDLRSQYVCIYLEANVELDAVEFAMEDLLLVLVRAVEQVMRERKTPLPAKRLKDVERWFTEAVITQTLGKTYATEIQAGAQAKGGLPFFAELFAKLTSLFKVSSEHREQVKSTLRRYPGELTRQVNSLFSGAAEVLSKEQKELLLLIDNMDRYSPKLNDELLVRDGDRFRQLGCSLIVTPPIGLILRPESDSVDSIFKSEVMPTVRLRASTEPYASFSRPGPTPCSRHWTGGSTSERYYRTRKPATVWCGLPAALSGNCSS